MEPTTWPPGWHPDPTGRCEFRYYNGQRWTSDVSIDGHRFVDHIDQPQSPVAVHPGWAQAADPARGPSRTYAVASFWVALGSFLCGWIPFIFVVAIGGAVAAFIFGVMALRRERQQPARGRGYATAGIVLSVAALGMSVIGFALTRSVMREVNAFLNVGPNTATIENCDTADGLTTLDGSISNDDTAAHGYTIVISYRSGDKVLAADQVIVPTVAPGSSATFHASAFVEDATEVECHIDSVDGPQPFTPAP